MQLLGVDTGGTFTDLVYFDGQRLYTHKELSTPDHPEQAILKGIAELNIDISNLTIVHGTTVATNALLEGKGARTVFITNHGFKDILLIGRQTRAELYNLTPKNQRSLFDPALNLEVGGRVSPQGDTVQPLTAKETDAVLQKIQELNTESVAICLLFSFVDNQYERKLRDLLKQKYFVSISSEVLAEYREYERGLVTWINSYLGPVMQSYLAKLSKQLQQANLSIMQSDGLTVQAEHAQNKAVKLLLSGPAGGLWGSLYFAKQSNLTRLLTFDMGGTSTDVSIINKDFHTSKQGKIAGLPISIPMLDIHTIGAGGGSIAWIDAGGLLQVGPHSAGAQPGPACYGQGGTQATVTDAHLVLGRLPNACKLAGHMSLNVTAAKQAIAKLSEPLHLSLEECALGIIRIANEHMAQALRVMSIHRGFNPKDFTLVSFGGAGGLHVCELANDLQIPRAFIPNQAGLLSALGLLIAPPGQEVSQTHIKLLEDCSEQEIENIFVKLQQKISHELRFETQTAFNFSKMLDLRYQGQSSTLKLQWQNLQSTQQAFHQAHKTRFGYDLEVAIELVNIRITAACVSREIQLQTTNTTTNNPVSTYVQLHGHEQTIPLYELSDREQIQVIAGPAIVLQTNTTLYIAENWRATAQTSGSLLLERTDN